MNSEQNDFLINWIKALLTLNIPACQSRYRADQIYLRFIVPSL